MRTRIAAGRVFGMRLWLHPSWFPVLVVVAVVTTSEYRFVTPGMAPDTRIAMGAVTSVAFFACLIAHEISHALVARRFHVRVRGITLFLFGGVAEIEGEVPHPAQEFAIALVGPLVSIAIGSILGLLAGICDLLGWTAVAGVAFTLALINLGVALFNLVPGLPLDGGRLLRATLWRRTGDRVRATRVAAGVGVVLGSGLGLIGVVVAVRGDVVGLWYILVGGFLCLLARASTRATPPTPLEAGAGALAWRRDEDPAAHPRS